MNEHTVGGRDTETPGAAEVADRLRAAPAEIDALRGRLAADAAREGLVDVAYRVVDSPIGGLLLAATPAGLAYVAFEAENSSEVLGMLADRIGPRLLRDTDTRDATVAAAGTKSETGLTGLTGLTGPTPAGILDEADAQISQYLAGGRREFDLPLDTRLATGFRGQVQRHLADIAYGRTATYGQLAADLDRPGAVRAVGTACATNPLPLVWPCHRVLRSDGGLGGYRGGVEAKQRLLAIEQAA